MKKTTLVLATCAFIASYGQKSKNYSNEPLDNSSYEEPIKNSLALPPSNDECANAQSITPSLNLASCNYTNVNTSSATKSQQTSNCWSTSLDDDVWYSFTANSTQMGLRISNKSTSTGTIGYSLIQDSCGATEFTCGTAFGDSAIFLNTVSGKTYYLRVFYSGSTTTGTFDMCIYKIIPPPPPANDDCSSATIINPTLFCAYTNGTLLGASSAQPADSCAGYKSSTALDVWYKFTATSTSHYVVVLPNASLDMVALVYNSCGGAILNCSDAPGSGASGKENIKLNGLTINNTYYVRAYAYGSGTQPEKGFQICVSDSNSVSINDVTNLESKFDIYPNPANEFLNINIKDNFSKNCIIQLIDIQGNIVLNNQYSNNDVSSNKTLNTKNLSSGMYGIRIISDNYVYNKKVLISK